MQLQVANNYKPLIDQLYRQYGGTVQRHADRYNPHARPGWRWCLSEQAACRLVKKLRPYLFVKARQAELLLRLGALKAENGQRRLTKAKVARRLRIAKKCSEFNARGR